MAIEKMPIIVPEYERKYEEIIKQKLLFLFKNTTAKIFLYGSRARGDYRHGADFDIAVESIDYQEFQRLKIQFETFWEESIVPYTVDLVFFENVNSEFKKEAKKNIVLWKTEQS